MIKKYDEENKFVSIFDPKTGVYLRTGVLDLSKINKDSTISDACKLSLRELAKCDTGEDPFMATYPELIDVGIMQTCACSNRCNVDCYQKAIDRTGKNMSLNYFESILKQSKGKVFQIALGGAGDVDTHQDFEEIVRLSREYNIVPNFTTSGILFNERKVEVCKKYCGAIAVSEHFADYTDHALDLLIDAGVKTNIHYVLSNKTIDTAIERLKNNSFKQGINAVVFLLYKPIGLGKDEYMLSPADEKVEEFFQLIDNGKFHHKVGFDSCSCSGIVNFTQNISLDSIDFCEGARYSAYIDANMNMMPCSFANQDSGWFMNLKEYSIDDVWNSSLFDSFRYSLKKSCSSCSNRIHCAGGCPLVNKITLCNKKEKRFETI